MRGDADRPLPVMPWWVVTLGLAGAVAAGVAVIWWLLGEASTGPAARATLRIDAIRTGLTVVAGTGGAVALLFAARRQWLAERAQRHTERVDAADRAHADRVQAHQETRAADDRRYNERVAADAERDATERRITDLFAKAVDQLGAGTAAARLGGLYALERLAQTYPEHRPTIVAMICGYLRMPATGDDPQEPQVRRTAQRILCRHLRPDTEECWGGVVIELSGAVLTDFDASGCRFGRADFAGSRFEGPALFDDTTFDELVTLHEASFADPASFVRATFRDDVRLAGAVFGDRVDFTDAEFARPVAGLIHRSFGGPACFRGCRFRDTVTFDEVRFAGRADFDRARFAAGASFNHATFDAGVTFRDADFAGLAYLRYLQVHGDAVFTGATFGDTVNVSRTDFHGSVRFDRVTRAAAAYFERCRASADGARIWPDGLAESPVTDGWITVAPTHPDSFGRLPAAVSAETGRSG